MAETQQSQQGDDVAAFDDFSLPPEPPPEPDYPDYKGGPASQFRRPDGRHGEYRQLPHDKDAEMGVLGALMHSSDVVTDVIDTLEERDFFFPQHQVIFKAVFQLWAENKKIDPLLVVDQLDRFNNLERAGGPSYVHTLYETVPTAANARHYAQIVADKAVLRRLVDAGTRIVQFGYEGEEGAEIDVVLDHASQVVYEVAQRKSSEDYAVFGKLITPTLDEIAAIHNPDGRQEGVQTGFIDLDKLTNGLHAGQMIIVAARPGVGKSTLALDFMRSASIKNNKTSVIFSLEMSSTEIMMRILSAETEIKLSDMRGGKMGASDWEKFTNTIEEIQDAPLYIDDSPNITMTDIRSKSRKLKQQYGLDLIVLDYLQLMSSGKRVESRQQEVSEFSRQLKLLAKELEVPLVAISQLNRGPESRTDKKPQLADLRESGSLEQDADMVFLLYRPDSQDPDNERAGEADIIVAKHRGGPIDTIPVAHQLHYSRFVNMAHG